MKSANLKCRECSNVIENKKMVVVDKGEPLHTYQRATSKTAPSRLFTSFCGSTALSARSSVRNGKGGTHITQPGGSTPHPSALDLI